MGENDPSARIAFTTASDPEEAGRLARALVDQCLAACVTIIPQVRSIYRWEGKIEDSAETLLLIKTTAEQIAAVQAQLRALHSYQTPEFLVIPVESLSPPYFEWLLASVRKP